MVLHLIIPMDMPDEEEEGVEEAWRQMDEQDKSAHRSMEALAALKLSGGSEVDVMKEP